MEFDTDGSLVHTDPGKAVCEDVAGVTARAGWVLDGATGLGEGVTDSASDGRWYVEQFDRVLREALRTGESRSLNAVVRDSIETVREAYLSIPGAAELPQSAQPTAGCAVVRATQRGIEYFVLGDCTLVIDRARTTVDLTDPRVRPVEQDTVEEMHPHITEGADAATARRRVDETLRRNRERANAALGYPVLGLDPEAAAHGLHGAIEVPPSTRLVLCTDGFADLVETFDCFDDWGELTGRLADGGDDAVDEALEQLRAAERADPDCRAYPRTKPADDAAVAVVRFEAAPSGGAGGGGF